MPRGGARGQYLEHLKNFHILVCKFFISSYLDNHLSEREARWPSGKASDSGARGWGLDPHSGRRVVSLSKIHLPPRKYW